MGNLGNQHAVVGTKVKISLFELDQYRDARHFLHCYYWQVPVIPLRALVLLLLSKESWP
jgi:hypothetical protein